MPRISVTEKLHCAAFRSARESVHNSRHHFRAQPVAGSGDGTNNGGEVMRDSFENQIPDTTAYKEWLGVVGSMMAAVAICAVLFAGGIILI